MPQVTILKHEVIEGTLPATCIICGAPASEYRFPHSAAPSLAWTILPFWARVLIGDRGNEKKDCGLPFCNRHRHYWTRRAWFIIGGLLPLIATFSGAPFVVPKGEIKPEGLGFFLVSIGACWTLIYLPTFMILHLCSTRPIASCRESITMERVCYGFVAALGAQEHERMKRLQSAQADLPVLAHKDSADCDKVQTKRTDLAEEARTRTEPAIDNYPLSQKTGWGRLYNYLTLVVAIGGAYAILRQFPSLPQVTFYPILGIILFLFYLVKKNHSRVLLRIDSRVLEYGPIGKRTRIPFTSIMAIQLLRVLQKGPTPFQINIVLGPHVRLHFFALQDQGKAESTANSISDLVNAPIVDQVATCS